MTQAAIGVDISKDHLDVHRLPDRKGRRFANNAKGLRALIAWLAETPLERIVFEATGAYHRAFERALGQAGLPLCKVNPKQARRFAEATGKLAKTDRADAAMLARFAVALQPQIRPAKSQVLVDLKELHVARQALIKDRTAAKNRAKILSLPLLKRQNKERLAAIQRQIETIDAAIAAAIGADKELSRRFEVFCSIPCIGPAAAVGLIVDMPELGRLSGKQAASLAGLAPVARQSGGWTGHAHIAGGRADLRQALYMPALVAARHNPDLKATYDALIAAGKPAKVALTAIMRKLIVLANALLRDGRVWTPNGA